MLFLNNQPTNRASISRAPDFHSDNRNHGQFYIFAAFFCVAIGLILIVVGAVNEQKSTIYIGISLLSLSLVIFFGILLCFYGGFNRYYNNWAYRSRAAQIHPENPQINSPSAIALNNELTSPTKQITTQVSVIAQNDLRINSM